jgi:hypothetical protein
MMIEQAFFICASEITNGGEIRRQFAPNKNQSVRMPFAIHASVIFLLDSKESNSIAIHKPKEMNGFYFGIAFPDR